MADRTNTTYAAEGSVHGYGVQALVGDGASPEAFEAVAGVRSVSFGDTETADIDVTHLRSPNAHREHRAGMRDSSVISIAGIYLPAEDSHKAAGGGSGAFAGGGLPAMAEDRAIRNFIIRMNEGSPYSEVEIRGYVKKFALTEANDDNVIEFNLEIMPTQAFDLP